MQSAPLKGSRTKYGRVIHASRPTPDQSMASQELLLATGAASSFHRQRHHQRRHQHGQRPNRNRHRDGDGGAGLELVPLSYNAEPSFYRPPTIAGQHSHVSSQNNPSSDAGADHSEFGQMLQKLPPTLLPLPLLVPKEILNVNPRQDFAIPLLSHGCFCVQCVRSQEIGFSEQCGDFQEILGPGLHCLAWPWSTISGRLSLRIQQLDITCRTNTADKVFCRLRISVLFKISVPRAYEAYYGLDGGPVGMIQAVVLDAVRSKVPFISLDELFVSQSKITDIVFEMLYQVMIEYGYEIRSVLMSEILPNDAVRAAMNEINVNRRLKLAASHLAEAHRAEVIREAESKTERLHLDGVGTAQKRHAIVKGMEETVDSWMDDVYLVSPSNRDVMDLLVMSQYLDLLSAMKPNAVIMRPEPIEVVQMRQSVPAPG
jgi:regulator of protease activity HflC (stomatin/prohibitin superfamily)